MTETRVGEPSSRRLLRSGTYRALSCVLGLLAAETLLRLGGVAFPAWDRPTATLGEWGVPNARGWAVGETRQLVELNSEGARDVDHTVAPAPGVHRVLVLGDSFAAAFEVKREEAFWAVMGDRLESCPVLAGRTVEVINLSKRGFGTAEELLVFRKLGIKYAPDQVVLAFFTGNDFRNNSPALKSSRRPYFRLDGDRLVLDESYADRPAYQRWLGWPGDLWYGLVRNVRLVQVGRQLYRQMDASVETLEADAEADGSAGAVEIPIGQKVYLEPDEPAWQDAWRVSERLVTQLRDEVEARNAHFVFMTLSNADQVHPDPSVRLGIARRIGAPDLAYPERRFERFADEQGIFWTSPIPELIRFAESTGECVHGFPGRWLCDGHWNADGHRIAGEVLARALCEQLSVEENGVSPDAGSSASPAHRPDSGR